MTAIVNENAAPPKPKNGKNPGPWLKNPKANRKGETIGGGWWVFRRGRGTNRIRPSMWPFEYATRELACEQAGRLAEMHPDCMFAVVHQTDAFFGEVYSKRAVK